MTWIAAITMSWEVNIPITQMNETEVAVVKIVTFLVVATSIQ